MYYKDAYLDCCCFKCTVLKYSSKIFLQLSQWLSQEDALPFELCKEPLVWDLLFRLLALCDSKPILFNALKALNECLENGDEADRQAFAMNLWGSLPDVLSRLLIEYNYGHGKS